MTVLHNLRSYSNKPIDLCYGNTVKSTIRDVARLAGVSAMTVSRVINHEPRVSEETRRRVEAAVAELGYVPRRVIRRKTIGLVVPDIANPFFTLVVRGAEDVAWSNGRHVILCNSQGDLERERGHLDDLLAFGVEGILIAPVSDRSAPRLRALKQHNLPFVLLDRSVAGYDGDLVQGDSVAGARTLVEHLIALGHRRIAMIAEPTDVSTARDRIRGYREALEAAGIEVRLELVAESGAIDPQSAHDATLAFPRPPEPADGDLRRQQRRRHRRRRGCPRAAASRSQLILRSSASTISARPHESIRS